MRQLSAERNRAILIMIGVSYSSVSNPAKDVLFPSLCSIVAFLKHTRVQRAHHRRLYLLVGVVPLDMVSVMVVFVTEGGSRKHEPLASLR